jgi:uncharacterized FlgJ-related protein
VHDSHAAHEHPHTHDHAHDHSHEHSHGGFDSVEQAVALLTYMLEHNRRHAEELHDACHKLEDMGKAEAAEKLGEALHGYSHACEHLAEALEVLKKEARASADG